MIQEMTLNTYLGVPSGVIIPNKPQIKKQIPVVCRCTSSWFVHSLKGMEAANDESGNGIDIYLICTECGDELKVRLRQYFEVHGHEHVMRDFRNLDIDRARRATNKVWARTRETRNLDL